MVIKPKPALHATLMRSQHRPAGWPPLFIFFLVLRGNTPCQATDDARDGRSPNWGRAAALEYCKRFDDNLFKVCMTCSTTRMASMQAGMQTLTRTCAGACFHTKGIKADLSAWPDGIERSLVAASISKFSTRGKNKGIALAFRGGVAYVVEAQLIGPVGHHATIYFQYMEVRGT